MSHCQELKITTIEIQNRTYSFKRFDVAAERISELENKLVEKHPDIKINNFKIHKRIYNMYMCVYVCVYNVCMCVYSEKILTYGYLEV